DQLGAEPGLPAEHAGGQAPLALQLVDHVLHGEAQPHILADAVHLAELVDLAGQDDAEQDEHAGEREHQHPRHVAADRPRSAQRVAGPTGRAPSSSPRRRGAPVDMPRTCAMPCAHLSTSEGDGSTWLIAVHGGMTGGPTYST